MLLIELKYYKAILWLSGGGVSNIVIYNNYATD